LSKFDEPIAAIRTARTHSELDHAMAKYREQLLKQTPALRSHYTLNAALQQKQYFRALTLIPLHGYRGRRYVRLTQVIELAADKQFSIARGLRTQ
jgi:hypothetical protein